MAVKIATAPCSWGVWYADGTPSKTPARLFLDQARQAGYKALELGPDGYLPEDREVLKQELSSRGLEAASGTACYRFDQYERFADFRPAVEKLCGRVASMGCTVKRRPITPRRCGKNISPCSVRWGSLPGGNSA